MTKPGKTFLWLLCVPLILGSCKSGSHYVSSLPPTPMFENAGEVSVQVGSGNTQTQFQANISPLPHLGFSYTRTQGIFDNDRSFAQSGTVHLYSRLGPGPYYGSLHFGLEDARVQMQNIEEAFFILLPIGRKRYQYDSRYQSRRFGMGLYMIKEIPGVSYISFRTGVDLIYRETRFSRMSEYYVNPKDEYSSLTEVFGNPLVRTFTPIATIQVYFGKRKLFYYRQSVALDLLLSPKSYSATLTETKENQTSGSLTTINVQKPPAYLYATLGFNINTYRFFKRSGNEKSH